MVAENNNMLGNLFGWAQPKSEDTTVAQKEQQNAEPVDEEEQQPEQRDFFGWVFPKCEDDTAVPQKEQQEPEEQQQQEQREIEEDSYDADKEEEEQDEVESIPDKMFIVKKKHQADDGSVYYLTDTVNNNKNQITYVEHIGNGVYVAKQRKQTSNNVLGSLSCLGGESVAPSVSLKSDKAVKEATPDHDSNDVFSFFKNAFQFSPSPNRLNNDGDDGILENPNAQKQKNGKQYEPDLLDHVFEPVTKFACGELPGDAQMKRVGN